MITVSEAKKLIRSHVQPLAPVTLGLAHAAGHILARDVFADCNIPAFRQSSMDGYALKFEDHQLELHLVGEMAAGTSQSFTVRHAEASRIFTGAPLPQGADTVVMQEKVSVIGGKITIHDNNLRLGMNVREQGAEIKAGNLAMEKGSLLNPAAIGFLAGIGLGTLEVFPMPKVAIIVTGKELQRPGIPLAFGQVYESNSYSLTAALKLEGIEKIRLFQADDDLDILSEALKSALADNDVVLLTGGVSVGDYDFVIGACQACDVEQVFHKVKQKPGKPLYFGKKGAQLIFGLPGNPSSVLSCYYNYVLPALKLHSQKEGSVRELSAKLTSAYTKHSGLTHFLKGTYENGEVTPLNAQESFRLSSFAQANCLICLCEGKETFDAGEMVQVMLLPL